MGVNCCLGLRGRVVKLCVFERCLRFGLVMMSYGLCGI